ncbi:MAG TPA: thermonuclease family protein [Candidatus Limnocylindrales bacterium]|nr:thermonuclease family protein [Candidatus Limnocylindrales bacterium]
MRTRDLGRVRIARVAQATLLIVAVLVAYNVGASRRAAGVAPGSGGSVRAAASTATPTASTIGRSAEGSTAASTQPPPEASADASDDASAEASADAARFGLAPSGTTEQARVVRVVDGDTIVVDRGRGDEKLRYIGMDTPETVDPNSPVEWMGPQASKANSALVAGRTVWLEKDVSEVDRYDRLLRDVWLRDESRPGGWLFVNLELVRTGFAQVSTFPPDVRYVDILLAAEREARAAGIGLWGPAPSDAVKPTAVGLVGPLPSGDSGTGCSPSYTPCLPIVGDLDCADVRALGKAPVTVVGPDVYRLDGDGDGRGCD